MKNILTDPTIDKETLVAHRHECERLLILTNREDEVKAMYNILPTTTEAVTSNMEQDKIETNNMATGAGILANE